MIRVILVDDHEAVRNGIHRILAKASNICVVGQTRTGPSAIQLAQQVRPDVILLDMDMSDKSGIEVTRELRANNLPISILILSASCDDHFVTKTLQMGVDGFIRKREPASKIRAAIIQVSEKYKVAIAALLLFGASRPGRAFAQTVSYINILSLD